MPNTRHRAFLNTMIVVISGSIIILSTLAGPNKKVFACEAFPPGAPSQDTIDNSAAVFSGKVTKFEKITLGGEAGDKRIAFFEVDRYWKTLSNENDYKQLIVMIELDSGACGYDFEAGKSYLVYSIKWWYDSNSLYTGLGYGTQPIEDAQEHLDFLGEGKAPTKQLSWDEQINRIAIQTLPTGQEQQAISTILSIVGIGAAIAGAVTFFSLKKLKEKK